MKRLIFVGLMLLAGCCTSGKKICGTNYETVNIDVSYRDETRKVPIYCCTTVEEDGYYFVKNSYTLNLPEGWSLRTKDSFHVRKKKDTFYFSVVAMSDYPAKRYIDFQIIDTEDKMQNEVKLPIWHFNED